jgi:hypothetical protein
VVFFTDTNGGNNPNPGAVAAAEDLTGGYKGLTGDTAYIRQGDDFLSRIVPMIMASRAYRNHGAIITPSAISSFLHALPG